MRTISNRGDGMNRAAEARPKTADDERAARDMQPHALKAAELLKALANEQRLMILCHLLQGPHSVGQLNERVLLSQSALSQHLAVLRESGIVRTEREAQSVWYSLPPGVVRRLIAVLHGEFCKR
jgi:ArsR family transcriptional regulator, virulence genes transcriptional regulator